MSKVEQKTKAKGAAVESTIPVVNTENKGLTVEGQEFLRAYEARVLCGKAFAQQSKTLRQAKSEETFLFWKQYAVSKEGFAGEESFIAPQYSESALWERLKALGWQSKRLPTAQKAHCAKLRIPLSTFERACLCQEEAARAALRKAKEDTFNFTFPDGFVEAFAKCISDDAPVTQLLSALQRKAAEYLRNS